MSNVSSDIPQYYVVEIQKDSSPGEGPLCIRGYLPENFQFSVTSDFQTPLAVSLINSSLFSLTGMTAMTSAMTAQLWAGSDPPVFTLTLYLETESDTETDIRRKLLDLISLASPTISEYGLLKTPGPRIKNWSQKDYEDAKDKAQAQAIKQANVLGIDTKTNNNGNGNSNGNNTRKAKSPTASLPEAIEVKSDPVFHVDLTANQPIEDSTKPANEQTSTSKSKVQKELTMMDAEYWTQADVLENNISIRIGKYLYFSNVVVTEVSPSINHIIDLASGLPQSVEVQISFKSLFLPTMEAWENIFLPAKDVGIVGNYGLRRETDSWVDEFKNFGTDIINGTASKLNEGISKVGEGLAKGAGGMVNGWFGKGTGQ